MARQCCKLWSKILDVWHVTCPWWRQGPNHIFDLVPEHDIRQCPRCWLTDKDRCHYPFSRVSNITSVPRRSREIAIAAFLISQFLIHVLKPLKIQMIQLYFWLPVTSRLSVIHSLQKTFDGLSTFRRLSDVVQMTVKSTKICWSLIRRFSSPGSPLDDDTSPLVFSVIMTFVKNRA